MNTEIPFRTHLRDNERNMKTRLCILFTLLLVILPVSACSDRQSLIYGQVSQPNNTPSTSKEAGDYPNALESDTISPYQLEEYINRQDENEVEVVDFKPVWERLQVPRDQEGIFDGFIPSYSRWRAEIIETPSSTKHAATVILKIAAEGGANRRYLIFKRSSATPSAQWRFSGYIDILDNKYEASAHNKYHKIFSNVAGDWLILRELGASGTGVLGINELWYKIDEERPQEVLNYPVEYHRVMGNISDLECKASVDEPELEDGAFVQQVRYFVSFAPDYKPKFQWLFSKKAKVRFVWSDAAKKFLFDDVVSEISQEEFKDKFGGWDDQKFIEYNLDRFVKIARTGNEEQKEWLKRVLGEIKDPRQQGTLQQALQQ